MSATALNIPGALAGSTPALLADSMISDVTFWVIILLGLMFVLAVVVAVFKRMATGNGGGGDQDGQLKQLEQLRRQRDISEAEYRRARDSVLGTAGRGPPAGKGPPPDRSDGAGGENRRGVES